MVVSSSPVKANDTIKFLCSYGGMILPRQSDGKLRYVGGDTRVLAVDRSLSFAEILVKLGELCGSSVILRCQLPTEDLDDALISITSDEDLANLIEEYDRASKAASSNLKIRAFLSTPKSIKKISPPSSAKSSIISDDSTGRYSFTTVGSRRSSSPPGKAAPLPPPHPLPHHHHHPHHPHHPHPHQCLHHQISKPTPPQVYYQKSKPAATKQMFYYVPQGNPMPVYLVHNGNYWQ